MSTPANFSLTDPFANTGLLSLDPLTLINQDIEAAKGLAQNGVYGLFGYVSPDTKAQLQSELNSQLTQAGMDSADAQVVANSTVASALTSSGADPTQAPWFLQNWKTILVLAGIGLGLYLIAPFVRR